MQIKHALGAGSLALGMTLGSLGAVHSYAAGKAAAPKVTIQMGESKGHYAFKPVQKTVSVGTKVTWVNNSDAPHNVTSKNMKTWRFKSRDITRGHHVSAVMKHAGTFTYRCTIHPGMVGKLIVK